MPLLRPENPPLPLPLPPAPPPGPPAYMRCVLGALPPPKPAARPLLPLPKPPMRISEADTPTYLALLALACRGGTQQAVGGRWGVDTAAGPQAVLRASSQLPVNTQDRILTPEKSLKHTTTTA